MGEIKSYKDLIVWRKSFELAKLIYKITAKFPQSETYGLANQLRRAAVSIPSNIAEGFSRGSVKERLQFFQISFGSASEVETQLLLAKELDFAHDADYEFVEKLIVEVKKMLNTMLAPRKNPYFTKS
ncbi:MAG TPA: four helix bundle protein [Candidatus Paceibacterota bacterium]